MRRKDAAGADQDNADPVRFSRWKTGFTMPSRAQSRQCEAICRRPLPICSLIRKS